MSPELQRACRQMPKTFSLVACSLLMFFKYCMHFHGLNYILSFSNQRVSLACHLHGVLPGQGYGEGYCGRLSLIERQCSSLRM